MTYQDDPNMIRRRSPGTLSRNNTGVWLAGTLAAIALIALIAFGISRTDNVASNDRPAATTTTGSGASTTGAGGSARTTPATNAPASR